MQNNLGQTILKFVGGEDNIQSLTHCATRLRMSFKNKDKVDEDAIKKLDGVLGTMEKGGQFQIIIGQNVPNVYSEMISGTSLEFSSINNESTEKKNIITVFLDTVAGIFTPLLPLLAGSGVLRGIVLLLTQVGWLSDKSSTYTILTVSSTAVFYFLPVLLAFTSAKKFGANQYVAVAILGALMMPDFVSLMGEGGNGTISSFIGIPVVLMSYSSTVVPAILAVWCQAKLEKVLKKIIPISLQLLFVSLITLLIMVPLTAIVFGPFGVYVSEAFASLVDNLIGFNGWIAGAFIGGIWNVMVIFGLQWAVNPIMIQNISILGFDKIVPLSAAANFGMAGAAMGTLLRTKDKEMKSFSVSALLSIFFAGITEPAIYGIAVKLKKPLIGAIVGGAVGGAFIGGMGVNAFAFVFGGLTTIPAFAGSTLIYYILGLVICFVVGTIVTMILGVDESPKKKVSLKAKETIPLPLSGEIIALEDVKDSAFSSGAMGPGIAVVPNVGQVYAPFDGVVTMLFETNHAIGLTSDSGIEILIHIGLDTVELNGAPFNPYVKQGDQIKKGMLIMEFNIEELVLQGYDITTPMIITNANEVNAEFIQN